MGIAATTRLSAADYLAWEAQQTGRNEYVDGEIFAMVGVTRKHATVTVNIVGILSAQLADGPCRVYSVDMKLRVEAANAFYYPDVFVTCDPRDHQADNFMSAPVLIVEVLSESTAAYDRGNKFTAYRKLASLKEYVLIDPESRAIECFRKGADGLWVLHEPDPGGLLTLESVGVRLDSERIFHRAD